jgi:hypothetical protein
MEANMGKLGWLLGVVAIFGCDNNRNVAVSNENPLGTVGGTVLDVNGELPLANAVVSLQTAGTVMMAMTDATGVYTLAKVPAGSFFLNISVTGYESAYVPGTLTGAVGNFPVSNPQTTMPTVELFKTDNAFTIALVDDRGAPVPGVTVTARPQIKFFAYDYPYGGGAAFPTLVPFGQYTVSATSDAMGIATFTGLPNAVALNMANSTQMFIDVPPITIMGSTTYQYLGESLQVNPTHVSPPAGSNNTFTIQLVGPNAALTVLYSSIDYLIGRVGNAVPNFNNPVGSVLPTDKPISITFNQAVDQKTLRAQLLDESGVAQGNLTAAFVAGNIVQLTPATAFGAGKRYNLVLHASPLSLAGTANGTPLSITAPFFTAGPATVAVTATLTTLPVTGIASPAVGKIVMLSFSEAVGIGRGAAAVLPCVGWYEGIDLDNTGTVSYQGEWATSLQACPAPIAPIAFDVTRINSFEPSPSAQIPTTGFATRWWAQVDDTTVTGGCKGGIAVACTRPTTATMMHLIFSHLDSTQTFTRANGQPVGDLTVAIQ